MCVCVRSVVCVCVCKECCTVCVYYVCVFVSVRCVLKCTPNTLLLCVCV